MKWKCLFCWCNILVTAWWYPRMQHFFKCFLHSLSTPFSGKQTTLKIWCSTQVTKCCGKLLLTWRRVWHLQVWPEGAAGRLGGVLNAASANGGREQAAPAVRAWEAAPGPAGRGGPLHAAHRQDREAHTEDEHDGVHGQLRRQLQHVNAGTSAARLPSLSSLHLNAPYVSLSLRGGLGGRH